MGRLSAAIAWVVLVGLAFGLAPPARTDQTAWVLRLLTGDWVGEEPWVVAQFQWMGLWPLWTALLLRGEARARPVPAWPFLLGSFALGCFALLPWFALRRGPRTAPPAGTLDHPLLPLLPAIPAVGLLGWAVLAGDPSRFLAILGSDGFVWPMTFDFAAFWIVTTLEARARARTGSWAWTLLPGLGLAAHLALEARARR